MSRVEAQQRFTLAMLARAFSDEQIKMLRSARIEDTDGYRALKRSMKLSTPDEVEGLVNRMLEGNPSLLDEIFVKLFQGEILGDAPSLAPRSESHKEALPRIGKEQ